MVSGGNFMMTWLNKIKERFDRFLYVLFGIILVLFLIFYFGGIIYSIINQIYN